MKGITCKQVHSPDDPLWSRIKSTYESSFPVCERRDFDLLTGLLTRQPRFVAYALLRDGEYAGFVTWWKFDDFSYVEHLAIDASARNGGIGGEAMRAFLAQSATPVVLEVEPPTDEMSRRRIGFYERLGFVLDSHSYLQPPYRKDDAWLPLQLMSYGNANLAQRYEKVRDTIYRYVYGVNESLES